MNIAVLTAILDGDFDNAFIANTPGGIERQEKEGQIAMIGSNHIPKIIRGATIEQLTELGFKFGAEVDKLFIECELPAGWKKQATEHSIHSDVLDDHGRRRASIFYKAAFYDRRAEMQMLSRFWVDEYVETNNEEDFRCAVMDGNTVVFNGGEWASGDYDRLELLVEHCRDWLKENYPDWENPLAYW